MLNQASHMAETLSSQIDGKIEGLKGPEFIPDPKGVDRLRTSFGMITVVRGTTDGESTAMVFGVDSPPELVLGGEDSRLSRGFLSRLRDNPLGRIAAGITLAAGAAVGAGAALGACSPNTNNPDQPPGLSTNHAALMYDQVINVGPGQLIPWSEWGDRTSNYGEIKGEKYIFVGRESNNNIIYVKCQAIEDCLAADADVQTVQGLEAAGLFGPSGPGVYQDPNGNDKFIALPGMGYAQTCDIAPNADEILEVSNCAEVVAPPISGDPSIFKKDGVPHALWTSGTVRLRNLHTNVTQDLPLDGDESLDCGVGFEAGQVAVGSHRQVVKGVTHCRLITALTLEGLANQATDLISLNDAGSNYLSDPRLAAGNILIYAREDQVPGDGSVVDRLWYAVIPPEAQPNPEPDAGTDAADTGPSPDALANEVADAADGAVAQPDTTPNDDSTPPQPDADAPPSPDPCDFANAKIQITGGACLLENCEDPFVDITGNCSFEVDLGALNPVKLEIAGTYQVDLLEKIGALLSGEYKVWDNGNQFDTVTGNLITGVEGTIYRGQLEDNKYFVQCDEGKITVYLIGPNGEKTPLITLKGGEGYVFDMDNPVGPIFNTDAEIGQPDTETGQPEQSQDAGNPGKDTVGTDASTSGTDNGNTDTTSPNTDPSITPGADPGPAPDSSKPSADSSSDGSGCSIDTASTQANFFNNLSSIGLALLSVAGFIGAMRRRREKKY